MGLDVGQVSLRPTTDVVASLWNVARSLPLGCGLKDRIDLFLGAFAALLDGIVDHLSQGFPFLSTLGQEVQAVGYGFGGCAVAALGDQVVGGLLGLWVEREVHGTAWRWRIMKHGAFSFEMAVAFAGA